MATPSPPSGWRDRVVLVTGGSRGIGRALCVRAASLGARVAVHYRTHAAGADETRALCITAGASPSSILCLQADLTADCAPPAAPLTLSARLEGSWRLLSFTQRTASDGPQLHPYGAQPLGRLVYARSGHMSVQIQRPAAERPSWSSGALADGSVAELAEAASTFRAYSGTWRIAPQPDAGGCALVEHSVETTLFPNRQGETMVRRAELSADGDRLTLTPVVPSPGMFEEELVWQREAASEGAAGGIPPGRGAGKLLQDVLAAFGRLDVLINNAGIFELAPADAGLPSGGGCAAEALAGDVAALGAFTRSWQRTLDTNLTSAAQLTWLAGRLMARQGAAEAQARREASEGSAEARREASEGSAEARRETPDSPPAPHPVRACGAIVAIGSRGAFRGEPQAWAYGASKAGLHAMTQCAAVALGGHGVVVAAVAPGFVQTDMVREEGGHTGHTQHRTLTAPTSPATRAHIAQAADTLGGPGGPAIRAQSPWGRVATPEEVAAAALYAAAFWECPWLSGSIIDVNGASYLR